jgi:hypothetical protein
MKHLVFAPRIALCALACALAACRAPQSSASQPRAQQHVEPDSTAPATTARSAIESAPAQPDPASKAASATPSAAPEPSAPPSTQVAPAAPSGPIALLVDGEAASVERMRDWLLATEGEAHLSTYAEHRIAAARVRELGIEVSFAEARAAALAEIELRIARAFNGDRAAHQLELAQQGRSPRGFELMRSLEKLHLLRVLALGRKLGELAQDPHAAEEHHAGARGHEDVRALRDARGLQALDALLEPGAAEQTVARIGDESISRADLGGWMLALAGEPHVPAMAEELRATRLARERGCEPSAAAIEARVAYRLERIVAQDFRGDRARFERYVEASGRSLAGWMRDLARAARLELIGEHELLASGTPALAATGSAGELRVAPEAISRWRSGLRSPPGIDVQAALLPDFETLR